MKKSLLKFRFPILLFAAALLVFAVVRIAAVKNDAAAKLAAARDAQIGADDIPFTKIYRQPLDARKISIWQSARNVKAAIGFNDSIFAATDGGLAQFSASGDLQKHWTVLDGLPESDLTALAVFAGKLFIGTGSSGLIAFDGERFENYRWKNREAKSITALLTDDDKLLIGTFAGGLIEFDGSCFREIKPENQSIKSVNLLAKQNGRLFVGTFDSGLWTAEAGRWRHFTVADGLPSNRVVGVAANGDGVFVGTDFGVAQTASAELFSGSQAKIFRSLAAIPALSGLAVFQNQIYAGRDDGEIFLIADGKSPRRLAWNKPKNMSGVRLTADDQNLRLTGSAGMWQMRSDNSFGASFTKFDKEGESLSSNVVSALAVDRQNRVWVGFFRDGIDVLSNNGERLAHLADDNLRQVNFLLAGEKMLAATAHGVTSFDAALRPATLTKNEGLASNSVMHIATREKDEFFATNRGLSFTKDDDFRVLTTVNGLPSDNVNSAIFYRGSLFVGTLGGLAEIAGERIVRVFKDSNSNLTNNWVSALCQANGRLFVGTYGGGVLELTAANELHPFKPEIGVFAVNPNAMFADEERLYIGTLDGVRVLELTSQKWTHLTDELPAKTVLSITGDADSIYFGTTGGAARINKSFWTENE